MNEQIHEELTLLEKELNRLDIAVRDIETAKEISKNVIGAADNLNTNFSMFYEKLSSSFSEIKGQHKNILNDYSKKFNNELSQMIITAKNEFDSANLLFNQNLDRFNAKIDEISKEHSNQLDEFDEKTNSIIEELNLFLTNNNELLDRISILFKELGELHLPLKFDKLDTTISSISQGIQNIQGRLDTLESNLSDKISILFKELDELHLPLKFDKLDTTISSISQGIQNIQGGLDTLESNLIRETDNQRKKISDEMEMVTVGMNNINHSMESKFVNTDKSFADLKKENRILGGILIVVLIVLVIQFFI